MIEKLKIINFVNIIGIRQHSEYYNNFFFWRGRGDRLKGLRRLSYYLVNSDKKIALVGVGMWPLQNYCPQPLPLHHHIAILKFFFARVCTSFI